ncbi:hypothetical protein ACFV4N_12360 [Actinosynnema sp. NPDC059797]
MKFSHEPDIEVVSVLAGIGGDGISDVEFEDCVEGRSGWMGKRKGWTPGNVGGGCRCGDHGSACGPG